MSVNCLDFIVLSCHGWIICHLATGRKTMVEGLKVYGWQVRYLSGPPSRHRKITLKPVRCYVTVTLKLETRNRERCHCHHR